MSRPPPPKLAPKPGQVTVVRALYTYTAENPDELSFEEGDTLYIIDKITDCNWWKAKCGERTGLVPSNYVEKSTENIDHPLHEAAKRGNFNFLKQCLSNKVSANGLDKAGNTPLHWACHGGHMDCAQELLKIPSICIDVQNKLGDTPLHSAAWKAHSNIVKLLLERGANWDIRNHEEKTPLDLAKDPATAAVLKSQQPLWSTSHSYEPYEYGSDEDSD